MSCPRNQKEREIVLDYCAGALDEARAREFERHMEQCGECSAVVAEQRRIWDALDEWRAPAVSGDFNARLYARIAAEDAAPLWRRWWNAILAPAAPMGFWKPAISLGAACAALAIGLMVYSPKAMEPGAKQQPAAHLYSQVGSQPATQLSTQPSVQTGAQVDMEQVANALDELDVLAPATI